MTIPPVVDLQHINKEFTLSAAVTVSVLRDVTLQITSGEMIAILGPSGSGKSTLMNLIGCLDIPTFRRLFFSTVSE